MWLYVTFLQTDTSMQYTCYEKLHPSNIRFLGFPTPLFQSARNALPFAPCECQFWPIGDVLMTGAEEPFEMPLCYWHFCSQLGAHHTPCPLRTTGTGGTRHASVRAGGLTQPSVARLRLDVSLTEKIYWDTCFHFDVTFVAHTFFWWQDPWVFAVRHFSFSKIKCIKIQKVKFGIMDLCVHLLLYTRQSLQCVCVEMRLCCTSSFLRRWLEAVMTR